MLVNTKAIVLGVVKYGDHGLVVKCFTYKEGLKSYLLQGVLKQKKGKLHKSQFLPLTLLQIQAKHNNKGALNRISEAKITHHYKEIHVDFLKQSLVYFLSEFLCSIMTEEEGENTLLFEFLEQAFLWLDDHEDVANFHLRFLFDVTKFLGFYPDERDMDRSLFFDLKGGRFVNKNGIHIIQGKELDLFKKALGIKFDELNSTAFSKGERTVIIELILKYYQLHMNYFKKPKSLEVLSKVLA